MLLKLFISMDIKKLMEKYASNGNLLVMNRSLFPAIDYTPGPNAMYCNVLQLIAID
jgi:hypothetical protein